MNPLLTRRSLLAAAGVAGVSLVVAGRSIFASSGRGTLIGSMKGLDRAAGGRLIHALVLLDLDTRVRRSIPLDFFSHGLAFDPNDASRVLVFEKKGPGACEIDLRERRVVRPLATDPTREFYGHAAFSSDGRLLFATESVRATYEGLVSVWDGRTLESLGRFPSFGEAPHDCSLIDDGHTLVVTNGGGRFPDGDAPSVAFVDLKSRKLLEKRTLANPRVNAGHVLVSKSREVAVASAPRDGLPLSEIGSGALSLGHPGEELHTMVAPQAVTSAMRGETLSLALDEPSGLLAATNPTGDQLSFWDVNAQSFVKAVTLDGARGVARTLDGAYFVVSHGSAGDLSFFSTRDLQPEPSLTADATGMVGSHLYPWDGTVTGTVG